MAAITEYKLIGTEDEVYEGIHQTEDWSTYPANRRSHLPSETEGPPQGMLFIKTGGNALQAVSKEIVEQQNLISVIVPEGNEPGDEIFVACPFVKDRLIAVTIPKNVTAGSAFLVRAPPVVPEIVTGIPVDFDAASCQTPIVDGSDVFAQDELALQEEYVPPMQHQQSRTTNGNNIHDAEEYEMVERNQLV